MVIYAIVNLKTQRAYIGRSARVRRRWWEHRAKLNAGTHPSKQLQADWVRDGSTWFAFITLETLPQSASKQEAAERELWHLRDHLAPYNQSPLTLTGPAPGTANPTPEYRERMRQLHLGKPKSELHRQRISAARKGKSYPHKGGYTLSLDTRRKMSLARTGKVATPESRSKRSATLKGRVFTQEWKDKIRAAKAGKPWSQKRREAYLASNVVV